MESNLHKLCYNMVKMKRGSRNIKKKRYLSINLSKLYRETIAVIVEDDFPHNKLLKHRRKFPPDWRGFKRQSLLRHLFKKYLFLKPEIKKRINDFKENHFKSKMIGIHIRQGDIMRAKLLRRHVKLENYPFFVNKLLKNHPDASIFLATDSRTVLEDYRAKYPAVVSTDKWYPRDEKIGLHRDPSCPDKVEMGIGALIDMYLLAERDWLVYSSQSSFARVARILSSLDAPCVFDT